ncbi:replication-associated recombination protein A [Patescibacteria group bacterium]|nr:replication-associated recombination protein A [Patescibacteria group bacterium]MBU4511674.1 replication-associated recombination protein A [Patescibacteria group bacterium]
MINNDLFSQNLQKDAPLADRIRAGKFSEFVGQDELIGKDKLLRQAIEKDQVPSMIFWGPPGCGKTTLARIIAEITKSSFIQLSAVNSGKSELQKVIIQAQESRKFQNRKTILFVDEIHRWNKVQQDGLLPYIENGTLTLIGATTENPSFEIISALLSRCRVFVLNKLEPEQIASILKRAIKDEKGYKNFKIKISPAVIKYLSELADGDARVALNALELAIKSGIPAGARSPSARQRQTLLKASNSKSVSEYIVINKEKIQQALQKTHLLYDRAGDEHYNIISALHKSMRGSDANAALYWLGRMLEAGEDPLYIARRIVRFASEDIGLANSQALIQAVSAYQACHFIGMPECELALAQAVVYMAKCKKSNELYTAYGKVKQDIKNTPNEPVPLHIRNAPTQLMKELDYSKGYKYSPDYDYNEEQEYLPTKLKNRKYLNHDSRGA